MECNKCGSRIGEFYRYEDEIYCFDCLLKDLEIEEETVTFYKMSGEDEYIAQNDILEYLDGMGIREIEGVDN